ncbi:MAG: glycoside hydrolase family 43 protein, partial [Acidimicrobiales bacterium]
MSTGTLDRPRATDGGATPQPLRPRGGAHRRKARVRWPVALAVLLLVAGITYGLVDDLNTQVRLHHTQVQETSTGAALATAGRELVVAKLALSTFTGARGVHQSTLNQVEGELTLAEQRLSQAQTGLNISKFSVTTMETCINGVKQAIGDLAAGQEQAAIGTVAGVAAPCQSLAASPGGPVYPFDFPDPDVIRVGGTYFAYGTNAAGGNIQIIQSTDLATWTLVGDALPQLPGWATQGATWAPAVLAYGRSFILFYATDAGPTECISVAVAAAPQGPFIDRSSGPLICQGSLGGSIDPAPYVSKGGYPYLTWKSNGGSHQPATIWAQPLAATGTALAPGSSPVALLRPTQGWEGSVVEGPFMTVLNGAYYLFYSGNNWDSANYAEGVAVCSGPLGPCSKPIGQPIYASQSNLAGPGGASVFLDTSGTPW